MPSQEEIDAIVGEKTEVVEKKPLTEDDYKAAVGDTVDYKKKYDELQKAFNKRDAEIKEARELKERAKIEEVEDDIVESPKGLTEEEVQRRIDEGIAKVERARILQSQMQAAVAKYSFVDEAETLKFISDRGGRLTIEEAIILKYPNELLSHNLSNKQEEIGVTDDGGRTITSKQPESDDRVAKKGFSIPKNGADGFQSFISKRIGENIARQSGKR